AVAPVAERTEDALDHSRRYLDVGQCPEPSGEKERVLGDGPAAWPEHAAEPRRRGRRLEGARPADEGVVEREDLVAAGLGPPQLDELPNALRVLRPDVDRLGEVVAEVEQRPMVGVEVEAALEALALDRQLPADVVGRSLPALVVDRAASEHLEVLGRARRRRRRLEERGQETGAVDRLLGDAVERDRSRDAGGLEDGGHEIDRVAELIANLAARLDPARPVNDQRRAHPAEPGVALPQAHRRVTRPRPAPRVVV